MNQVLVLAIVIIVLLRDALDAPVLGGAMGPGWVVALSLVPMAALVGLNLIAGAIACRAMDRTGRTRAASAAHAVESVMRVLAVAWHAVAVLGLGFLDQIRSAIGDWILMDEAIAVAPPLLVFVSGWWAGYSIDRRIREAVLLRCLDRGQPIHPLASRGEFLLAAIRHHLLIVLVPAALIVAWSEAVNLAFSSWAEPSWRVVEAMVGAVQAAGVLAIFIVMPLILRVVWHTSPLPPGRLRDRLVVLCRSHGVRMRDLLVWRTGGTIPNGAVMGLIGRVRYILLTDALLEGLSERQIEAVTAHEVAHVRHRHLIWLAAAVIATVGATGEVVLRIWSASGGPEAGDWGVAISIGVGLAAGLGALGFVSRRFEWQSDAFAARHLSASALEADEPAEPGRITARGAGEMGDALGAVAWLCGMKRERFSFRHGSIAQRQRRLRALVGLDGDALPIDRQVAAVKIATALLVAAWLGMSGAGLIWS